ncbi:MAG: hypothetical protein ACREGA_01210 [Candidatus Saccharimonadales bacterium]
MSRSEFGCWVGADNNDGGLEWGGWRETSRSAVPASYESGGGRPPECLAPGWPTDAVIGAGKTAVAAETSTTEPTEAIFSD